MRAKPAGASLCGGNRQPLVTFQKDKVRVCSVPPGNAEVKCGGANSQNRGEGEVGVHACAHAWDMRELRPGSNTCIDDTETLPLGERTL